MFALVSASCTALSQISFYTTSVFCVLVLDMCLSMGLIGIDSLDTYSCTPQYRQGQLKLDRRLSGWGDCLDSLGFAWTYLDSVGFT